MNEPAKVELLEHGDKKPNKKYQTHKEEHLTFSDDPGAETAFSSY